MKQTAFAILALTVLGAAVPAAASLPPVDLPSPTMIKTDTPDETIRACQISLLIPLCSLENS